MIRALINGEEWSINFRHLRIAPGSPNYIIVGRDARARAATLCEIRRGERGRFVDSFAQAFCSVDDNFSRETGRRLALSRAITRYDLGTQVALTEAYEKRKPTSNKPC